MIPPNLSISILLLIISLNLFAYSSSIGSGTLKSLANITETGSSNDEESPSIHNEDPDDQGNMIVRQYSPFNPYHVPSPYEGAYPPPYPPPPHLVPPPMPVPYLVPQVPPPSPYPLPPPPPPYYFYSPTSSTTTTTTPNPLLGFMLVDTYKTPFGSYSRPVAFYKTKKWRGLFG